MLVPYGLSEYLWNGNTILRLKQKIEAVLERIGQKTFKLWVRNDKKLKLFIFLRLLRWAVSEHFYYSRKGTIFLNYQE